MGLTPERKGIINPVIFRLASRNGIRTMDAMKSRSPKNSRRTVSRRKFIARTTTVAAAAAAVHFSAGAAPAESKAVVGPVRGTFVPPPDYRIENGRIRHSVMGWCFNPMPTEELMEACRKMGMTAMEGIDAKFYPKLRLAGMKPSLISSHGFADGPANPAHHANCHKKLRQGIDLAVEFGAPGVITFTGMREKDLSDARMEQNCVDFFKEAVGYAEQKGINLVLEHLNSRDGSHPMKGHPGYFGDDVARCARIIERVGSSRLKLLFDIYHVQIMHGDVIRRLRTHWDVISHIHTAGVPGRGEIDDTQEINYPPIMRTLLELGYQGYVAHEFIPTWTDKLASLRHGVRVCDV
jgi:hydroxypyruvate isomerase